MAEMSRRGGPLPGTADPSVAVLTDYLDSIGVFELALVMEDVLAIDAFDLEAPLPGETLLGYVARAVG